MIKIYTSSNIIKAETPKIKNPSEMPEFRAKQKDLFQKLFWIMRKS